jgi:putative transposase
MERELQILAGKVARDHVHLFLSYRPHQDISTIVQRLKGTTARILLQEFAHLRKQFWGRHLWARGYFCCSSGNVTDEVIAEYIANQSHDRDDDFKVEG